MLNDIVLFVVSTRHTLGGTWADVHGSKLWSLADATALRGQHREIALSNMFGCCPTLSFNYPFGSLGCYHCAELEIGRDY
ncbi:uncharacterized protein LY89DRAFT_684242 [Mollisia scopiformis]|uniref:Uncharacterized protein n=1 Tax=Mollisia scopiformis TaxID=149040 RepID=A0A194XDU3_MOLSC|nr:uncharacterized protein LY89DRAFT_684242 [Mollisia scopiformis]KUJ18321.1 hypothetical protein LY89DRAFT_684242 [Mollisia scopiformis]